LVVENRGMARRGGNSWEGEGNGNGSIGINGFDQCFRALH